MLVGNWARFQVQCLGVMAERLIDVEQTVLRSSLQGVHLPHPARQSVPTGAVLVHQPPLSRRHAEVVRQSGTPFVRAATADQTLSPARATVGKPFSPAGTRTTWITSEN